jgi:predicted ATPase
MLTRIEIDGFKSFDNFSLDLQPLTAVVGPNASGKSNLFDALRFLSLLAQFDIRTAMQDLRGEPLELFRQTAAGSATEMRFAVEVLLDRTGVDAFGTVYDIPAQRLRYEVGLAVSVSRSGTARGVHVTYESCKPLARRDDSAQFLKNVKLSYNSTVSPFIRVNEAGDALLVRQDGRQKHGRPVQLSLKEASKTALSTITTAEFPHLYAVRDLLSGMRFLEINPNSARGASDQFEDRTLRRDASNLSAVLARLQEETSSEDRPDGVLADISADLASLIPSVSRIEVMDDPNQRQYSFRIQFTGNLAFSSRVISDGTLRLLALLTLLNDPTRRGTLCFEEPENGVHEGRIPMLIEFLRSAVGPSTEIGIPSFQVLMNTHSPKVMNALLDTEIVAADTVTVIDPSTKQRSVRTRMRRGLSGSEDMFNPETSLTRAEVEKLLQHATDAA